MLARAVVVQRRRFVAGSAKFRRRFLIVRNVRPAKEVGFIELALPQQRRRGSDVQRFAAMRSARQRDLFTRELVLIDAAILEQRNGLKRLRRGSQTSPQARLARIRQQTSEGVDDSDRSRMKRLDLIAAIHARKYLHRVSVSGLEITICDLKLWHRHSCLCW